MSKCAYSGKKIKNANAMQVAQVPNTSTPTGEDAHRHIAEAGKWQTKSETGLISDTKKNGHTM